MNRDQMVALVRSYLELHNNSIAEPNFTTWLDSVFSADDRLVFSKMLAEDSELRALMEKHNH